MVTEYRIVADEQNPTPALSTQAVDVVGMLRRHWQSILLAGLLGLIGYLGWQRFGPHEPASPIVGPSWVAPGRVAFLDIPDVGGDPKVTVIPRASQFAVRSSDGGRFLLFSADQPGIYSIVYADIGGIPFWRRTILSEHAIQVSETPPEPGPEPWPTPPPQPIPPLDGYSAKALEWAKQVTADPAKAASAKVLASNFRAVASQAAAGGYQDAATLLGDLKNRNAASLAGKRDAWLPFFLALSNQLNADGFGTQGARQPGEYAAPLDQTAKGLEYVR